MLKYGVHPGDAFSECRGRKLSWPAAETIATVGATSREKPSLGVHPAEWSTSCMGLKSSCFPGSDSTVTW